MTGRGMRMAALWAFPVLAMAAEPAALGVGRPGGDDLEEIVVTSQRVQTANTVATTSAKSTIPLMELPQAISVVGADFIKDQGIRRLGDALSAVAGVSRSSTYGFYDAYTIRGYDAAYGSIYLDGMMETNSAGANNELAGLERVEVVKGPASALFGASPLGGIVNLVSKRPQPQSFVEVSAATGSYGLAEGSIDANAPLDASGSVLGRLNVLYRDTGDFVKFSGENRVFVAPALTWSLSDATHLTILGRYQRDRDSPWSPVTAYGTVLPSVWGELPIDFAVNHTGSQRNVSNLDRAQLGYVFDHKFNDVLAFTQTLRDSYTKTYWNNWVFSDQFVDNSFVSGVQQGHELGLFIYGPYKQIDHDLAVDSRMTAKVGDGAIHQEFMLGVDHRRNRSSQDASGSNYDITQNSLDILAPDYNTVLIHDPANTYTADSRTRQTGIYVQDHIGFNQVFFATLGGRWDWVNSDGFKTHAFSPNVGLNYYVAPGVSLYVNAARSFTPQFSWEITFDGVALPPETGRNYEGGVKLGTADDTLGAMVSVFQLTRENVATSDPVHPLYYVVTGQQRSRGLELEGTWMPSKAWTMSLAYTYIDAIVTRDSDIPVGTRLANVPRNNVYLTGAYTLQQGPLQGLGFNASVLYNSAKNSGLYEADINGDGIPDPAAQLPAYTVFNAGLSYAIRGWDARLNVNNLFDHRYYPDASDYTRVTPGAPRNWRLSLTKRF